MNHTLHASLGNVIHLTGDTTGEDILGKRLVDWCKHTFHDGVMAGLAETPSKRTELRGRTPAAPLPPGHTGVGPPAAPSQGEAPPRPLQPPPSRCGVCAISTMQCLNGCMLNMSRVPLILERKISSQKPVLLAACPQHCPNLQTEDRSAWCDQPQTSLMSMPTVRCAASIRRSAGVCLHEGRHR